jgi:hypothetical protein
MKLSHVTATALLTTGLFLGATACTGSSTVTTEPGKTTAEADDGKPAPDELTPDELAGARAAAGLPPSPSPGPRSAYISSLNALDTDIVHGKDDKAISRGLDECSTIKAFPGDRAKQISMANSRFSSPTHPEGHGLAIAGKILDVVHKNLCPDF